MAKIDVLFPVKNGISFLAEAIESICNQTITDWRLIVLDHGSEDGSFEMAASYAEKDSRIQVYQFKEAIGLSGLLNQGLDLCNCEFVMRHDADDIALPDRMQKTLDAFSKNPNIDVIGGHAIRIDGAGRETGFIRVPTDASRLQVSFFFKNPMIHPTVSIRFSAVESMGIRYGNDFLRLIPESERINVNGLAEDYFMFGQLGIIGKCLNIDTPLIKYRWHGENVGAKKFVDQIKLSTTISRYLARCFCLKHNVNLFDPVPFCSYGGTVLNLISTKPLQLNNSFNELSRILIRVIGNTAGLKRELAFRKVLSTRNELMMILNYMFFRTCHKSDIDEWYAIKIWVSKYFKNREIIDILA